jgi:hypothetical protein
MFSFLTLLTFIIIAVILAIAGIVLLATGIINSRQKQWIAGTIIISLAILTASIVIFISINQYVKSMSHIIEEKYKNRNLNDNHNLSSIDSEEFENNTYYHLYSSAFGNNELYNVSFYADEPLTDIGFNIADIEEISDRTIRLYLQSDSYAFFTLETIVSVQPEEAVSRNSERVLLQQHSKYAMTIDLQNQEDYSGINVFSAIFP